MISKEISFKIFRKYSPIRVRNDGFSSHLPFFKITVVLKPDAWAYKLSFPMPQPIHELTMVLVPV